MKDINFDLKNCGDWCTLSWTLHNEGEAPHLALKVDQLHFSTNGPEGTLPTWGYATMVDIPNDQGWFTGPSGGPFGIGPYICFGREGDSHPVETSVNLFFELAACKREDDFLEFAGKYGPLGWKLDAFFFDGYPYQKFLAQIENYRSQLEGQGDPKPAELEHLDHLVRRVREAPYVRDWREGVLPTVVGERVWDWKLTAQEIRDAIEVRQLVEEADYEEIDLRYPVQLDSERIESAAKEELEYGEICTGGLINYWIEWITNLEMRRPGFTKSRRHRKKWLYLEFLLFVINFKIAKRIWPSYRPEGAKWRYDSLFAIIWSQLAEFVVGYPEHTRCQACGKWFIVVGKARGRGKKTCSNSCRVRLSQKRRKGRGRDAN